MNNGYRAGPSKYYVNYVRSFQLLENCLYTFNSSAELSGAGGAAGTGATTSVPQIGDVIYSDKTYSRGDEASIAAAAAAGKTAIGVIMWVSEDGTQSKAVNLKNLATNGSGDQATFDPADPYMGEGKSQTMKWQKSAYYDAETSTYTGHVNITNIKDCYWESSPSAYAALTAGGAITVTNSTVEIDIAQAKQFNELQTQYDSVINDSSYKGVNLLKGESMEVVFNEGGENKLMVEGQDISTSAIGLNKAAWYTIDDVAKSINELKSAINTLRTVASNLGNNNAIIQTREEFTQDLIAILEEGADKLTLADMNEASADMLSLQTRQQLAINALSLATEAERGVLRLF